MARPLCWNSKRNVVLLGRLVVVARSGDDFVVGDRQGLGNGPRLCRGGRRCRLLLRHLGTHLPVLVLAGFTLENHDGAGLQLPEHHLVPSDAEPVLGRGAVEPFPLGKPLPIQRLQQLAQLRGPARAAP